MKKTALIATAVATAISGSAMAASHGGTQFYGNLELDVQSENNLFVNSEELTIGWMGSEDLGNGLTAGFKVEFINDGADAATNSLVNDQSYLTLSGDFGTVVIGRHDTLRGLACFTDTMKFEADRSCDMAGGAGIEEIDDLIAYVGASGDFTYGVGGIFVGSSADDDDTMHTTAGINYANGPLKAGLVVVDLDVDGADTHSIIGVSYQVGDITIAGALGDNGDDSQLGIQAQFQLDKDSHVVVSTNLESDEELVPSSVEVGYLKNLSKRTYIMAEFQDIDGNDDSAIRGTLGHNF